jgi:hypothetical protein
VAYTCPSYIGEWEAEKLQFKASLGKDSTRPYLKNKLKAKGLGHWLKWWEAWKFYPPYYQNKMEGWKGDGGKEKEG